MRIKLLVDKKDDYLGVHFKKGNVYPVLDQYMYGGAEGSFSKIIHCGGHGVYIYADEGEYEIIVGYGPMKWDKDEYGDHVQFTTIPNDDPLTAKDLFDFMHNK